MAWFAPDDLYPPTLMVCAEEPVVPARPSPTAPRDETAKANYVTDLRGAWGDCHDDVSGIKDRKARYAEQYDQAQKGGVAKFFSGLIAHKKAP